MQHCPSLYTNSKESIIHRYIEFKLFLFPFISQFEGGQEIGIGLNFSESEFCHTDGFGNKNAYF